MKQLDHRSSEIFRHVVEAYLETGDPVGSKTLSKRLGLRLSPATIRHVMADLERLGLLLSPHISAGRMPTQEGMRLFVDAFMEFGDLTVEEQEQLESKCHTSGSSLSQIFEQATATLSGLAECAGLILAPKTESRLKHVEFVYLNPGRALVVMITEQGMVENRIIEIPKNLLPTHLTEATNYLNHCIIGKSLQQARLFVEEEIKNNKARIDSLSAQVVEKGLATCSGSQTQRALIVKGQSHLLRNVRGGEEITRLQGLFAALETQGELLNLLDMAIEADGVQIFIGSHNSLFDLAGCTMILAPYGNEHGSVIGAIGVVGPARINYARIIPMVNYTAKLIGKIIG